MITNLYNWWNKDKLNAKRLEAELKALKQAEAVRLVQEEEERLREEYENDPHNSAEPWVEIVGDTIDPVKGISIQMDWNEAFIEYLQDQGFHGIDEDEIVQKWLAMLHADLSNKLNNNIMDSNTEDHSRHMSGLK